MFNGLNSRWHDISQKWTRARAWGIRFARIYGDERANKTEDLDKEEAEQNLKTQSTPRTAAESAKKTVVWEVVA